MTSDLHTGDTMDKPQRLLADEIGFSFTPGAPVLSKVSAEIHAGSFLAVLGVNGSGKSTLLNCLAAILKAKHGKVLLYGQDIATIKRTHRAQQLAYVAQKNFTNRSSVYDSLLIGRKPFITGVPTEDDYAIVDAVISAIGLESHALTYIDELSGGEYQKVVLGRALVQCTGVLLLDEPTNNLDIAAEHSILSLVRKLVDTQNVAAAAVMHDINLALDYCDRFLVLSDGRVCAHGGPEIITDALVSEVYGISATVHTVADRKIVLVDKPI
ncbi:ABC transporter ATP-binding protein [Corynebacterium cystitidis]|uniref:ABC transporter ATP-binding protein n=1 Tax=Corynebacterium cystitidis TaxID=35757 RepID=UPI00211E98C6|nr:ABC transporter ATP-binding protein [Corynebacterium cystitidis]